MKLFASLFTKKLLLIIPTLIFSNSNYIEPDSYTKEGFCVVKTPEQKYLGLLRFESQEEFRNKCNGKMIFEYERYGCVKFTMENMKFDIYISNTEKKYLFRIGEIIDICGKEIIETIE